MIRRDNSRKPSYEMLKKLIHEEWHTAGSFCTDENGYVQVEGFKGSYRVRTRGAEGHFELNGGSDSAKAVLA